jgi:putative hydrolase of the HAD superfamily
VNLRKPRVLVFDLGNVIVEFSVEKACLQIASVAGDVSASAVRSFLFEDGLEYRFEAGEFKFTQLHHLFEQRFDLAINPDKLKQAAADIFTPIPRTIEILKILRENHSNEIPMVLLSNTNEVHWEFIESNWGVSKLFDHLVLSYEVRSLKPEEKIYSSVLEKTGVDARDCFFVDDLQANVDAAKHLGFDATLFTEPEKLRRDLIVRGINV